MFVSKSGVYQFNLCGGVDTLLFMCHLNLKRLHGSNSGLKLKSASDSRFLIFCVNFAVK